MEISRIMELKLQGYCCSQIIMQMGLEGLGRENEDLITAMEGLCGGMHRGSICGTLSAALCLLYLVDKERAEEWSNELFDWFEDSFGSAECDVLIDGNPLNRAVICGNLVENTYLKLVEMFEDNNIDFQSEQ
jgi:hypothetical protein